MDHEKLTAIQDRRAPAPQTATGRLPLGTPGQPLAASSHSHIQIVPRSDSQASGSAQAYHDPTPTFRSPSLQFPSSSEHTSRQGSAYSEEVATGTTFADMARRYAVSDLEGTERPTSGPLPLVGLIRFQSGRGKKGNKNWRPLQPSDIDGGERPDSADYDADSSSSPIDLSDPQTQYGATRLPLFSRGSSPLHMQRKANASETATLSSRPSHELPVPGTIPSDDTGTTDAGGDVVETYTRLFGKLPDLIRLHEQTGNFDGQVVFIGHPNRDVSAHQWSTPAFQWVRLGEWSHLHQKVEGSLASDRLPDTGLSPDSIEYFRLVAKRREESIVQFGRPKAEADFTQGRPAFPEAERAASLSSASDTSGQRLPTRRRTSNTHDMSGLGSKSTSGYRNVTGEKLEDPFVTPARPPQPVLPASFTFRGTGIGMAGSMDFSYEFPVKPATTTVSLDHKSPELNPQQIYIQRERERLDMIRRNGALPREHETPTHLREVGFGEEASSVFATPAPRASVNYSQHSLSPKDIQDRQQLKNRLAELGGQADRHNIPTDRRVAIPDVQTNIRALFPPGPTVANPFRGVSTLNANAPPYTRIATTDAPTSQASVSEATTITAAPTQAPPRLQHRNSAREMHSQPVPNGTGKQAPTPQNFKGPFFSESVPTPNDPTLSLTIPSDNDENLAKWFRDGQRPARQQEYAKSLMAAASATNKSRNFGAIGQMSSTNQGPTKFENTPFFVRVYENLFEYAEESRAGTRLNYWTRSWTPAALHLRDIRSEGNNSFFGEATLQSPRLGRSTNLGVSPFSSNIRGGVRTPFYPSLAKYSHGVVAEGGFGGPV